MLSKVVEIFRVPDLRKKVLWTFVLLFVYRIGNYILLPGANPEAFTRGIVGQGGLFGVLNAISGSAIGSATVFSLGVMPYISASIVFSLLAKMVPALEQVAKEGAAGQKKINQWTRWATVPICLFQAFFVVWSTLAKDARVSAHPVISPENFDNFFYKMMLVLVLTGGTLFIMWLGEKISELGVGQGTSLIIMAGIVARVPTIFESITNSETSKTQFIAEVFGLFIVVVWSVVFFTKAHRRIPIQQAKLTRGRRQLGGARHFIPLKVNASGVMPIIFAQTIFLVPNLIAQIPNMSWVNELFGYDSFMHIVLLIVMIFFFAYFWTAIYFQPKEMANQLKEGGSFIPGIRPGQRTADFLEGVMVRTTLVGAAFLSVIALLPQFANEAFSIAGRGLAGVIGGTSILITVGVCLDLVDKINAQLVMRNYEGFTGSSGGWARRKAAGEPEERPRAPASLGGDE